MKNASLLALVVLVLLVAGAGLWFALGGRTVLTDDRGQGGAVAPTAASAGPAEAPVEEDATAQVRAVEIPTELAGERDVATTVAWPVEVELELVRASGLPEAEGVAPLGSGRRARLQGRVLGHGDRGVAATLRFEAGQNAGRELHANAEGWFGASDLYPGRGLVRVEGPGIPGSLREVRLVAGKETLLPISYGLPGAIWGTVYDSGGEPLEGVEVELDGRRTTTDAKGDFHYADMAAGNDLVLLLRKQGYATLYQRAAVSGARTIPRGSLTYAMERSASLEISVPQRVGALGPATVVLAPANTDVEQRFAWHTVSQLEVFPGKSVVVDGLPSTRVAVRVYHQGAKAKPPMKIAILRAGALERVTIELEPAPVVHGRVTDAAGLAVPRAEVVLEAPDRVAAAAMHLAEMPQVFDAAYIPPLPPAVQRTRADSDGRFTLTSWSENAPARYLTATSPDGKLWGGRVVRAGEEQVDLQLAAPRHGRSLLLLDFPGRHQGLPVVVSVGGETQPEVVLDVSEVLPLSGLPAGTWRISARWYGQLLFPGSGERELLLEGEARCEVPLPQGAIDGQDEDTLLRAGRE